MRPRGANEWRDFWRDGGERELHAQLGSSRRRKEFTGTGSRLSPSGAVDDSEHELREPPDLEGDAEVAARIYAWFEAASLAR